MFIYQSKELNIMNNYVKLIWMLFLFKKNWYFCSR